MLWFCLHEYMCIICMTALQPQGECVKLPIKEVKGGCEHNVGPTSMLLARASSALNQRVISVASSIFETGSQYAGLAGLYIFMCMMLTSNVETHVHLLVHVELQDKCHISRLYSLILGLGANYQWYFI